MQLVKKFCLESGLCPQEGEVSALQPPPPPMRNLPRTGLCPKGAEVPEQWLPPSPGGILLACF